VCNLYSITTNQAAIIALFRVMNRYVGNLPPMPGVFPDYPAPMVRNGADGHELAAARWGMPSSQFALMMQATKKRSAKLEANGLVEHTSFVMTGSQVRILLAARHKVLKMLSFNGSILEPCQECRPKEPPRNHALLFRSLCLVLYRALTCSTFIATLPTSPVIGRKPKRVLTAIANQLGCSWAIYKALNVA
jgi:hypothetical protein